MGWTPRALDACALWEVNAAIDGYKIAQGVDDGQRPPTADDHDRLVAKYG